MSAIHDFSREEPDSKSSIAALAEADHRIANSLSMVASLLRLQAGSAGRNPVVTGLEARRMLEEAAGRVEAVARHHRSLAAAPDGKSADSAAYFKAVCTAASDILDPEGRIRLIYDLAPNLKIEGPQLAVLGLLINEALTNTLKHAHPSGVSGEVMIACRAVAGDGLMITLEDDGVGLPEDMDADRDGGLGFGIMRALASQIGASVTHRSSPLGLRVQILVGL
jgi:two-component sensor histidine kinase